MTVVETKKDLDALTLTLVSELKAAPDRVWQLWSDPRQLERWWGPPTWPATFEEHALTPGGRSSYYMTGPEGQKSRGWWQVVAADEHSRIVFDDGFSDESGTPSDQMPVIHGVVDLEPSRTGTRMTVTSSFPSREGMEKLMGMGMVEGFTEALSQIDAILAG